MIWYKRKAIKVVVKFKNNPQNATWKRILKDFFTNSYKIGTSHDITFVPVFVRNHKTDIIAVHIVKSIAGIFFIKVVF